MFNYKLLIKYIGTNYYGWQRQKNHISVQETIEKKLEHFFKERIRLIASGRTDAGVHALGQVANFKVKRYKKTTEILKYLNSTLPRDISIISVEEVHLNFNSRFDAKGKTYLYKVHLFPDPFLYNLSWYVRYKLDYKRLKDALELIHNTKNLLSMAKKSEYLREDVKIREINLKFDGLHLEIEITASHFLRYMVRKIVGHSVKVATNSISLEDLKIILSKNDPSAGKFLAPPEGLYLKEVYY